MVTSSDGRRVINVGYREYASTLPDPLRDLDVLTVDQAELDGFAVEMMVTERLAIDLRAERTVQHIAKSQISNACPRLFPMLKVAKVILNQHTIAIIPHFFSPALQSLVLDFYPPYPTREEIDTHFRGIQRTTRLRSVWIRLVENPDPAGVAPWAEHLFALIPDRNRIVALALTGCGTSRVMWDFAATCPNLGHLSFGAPTISGQSDGSGAEVVLKLLSAQRLNSLDVEVAESIHPFDAASFLDFPGLSLLSLNVKGLERPKNLGLITQLHDLRYIHLQMPHLHSDLDHEKLLTIAKAWPNLQVLVVAEPSTSQTAEVTPALHIGSLSILAEHCPKLEYLEIVVNTTASREIRPLPSKKFASNLVLDLTGSKLDMASRDYVMFFLFCLCPKLQRFVIGYPVEAWEMAMEIWYEVANKEGQT